MSWGLCAFVSALGACHLCHRVFVHLLCLTGPPSMSRRCVHLSPLPGLALSIVVLACAGLGLPGLPSVTGLVCTCFSSPGPPSMLWGLFWFPKPTLCATSVLCAGEVCMRRLSWHSGPITSAVGLLYISLCSPSSLSGRGHGP